MKPAFVFFVAAVMGACASTARPPVDETRPVTASTVRAEIADLPAFFEAGGVVRARSTALVASRLMAPIAVVHVRPGDRVKRGAVLVTLDARDVQANRTRADAASLGAAESVRAAEGDLEAAEAALQLARLTHDRIAALHAKRSATTQELDQAQAAFSAAQAQRAGAQARLAAATAGRDAARAAADAAAFTSTYAVLTAPFDGIVTERNADPGSMATPGAPLLTVEDPAAYRLEVRIDERRAEHVAVGSPAEVRLDGGADAAPIEGHVVEIARVDPASHSFLVKIDLPRGTMLRSGLFGRARFSAAPVRALTVPAAALVRRGQLTFVFAVDAEKRARLRPVSTGTANEGRVEVLAGLQRGDVVVARPDDSLADGVAVAGDPR